MFKTLMEIGKGGANCVPVAVMFAVTFPPLFAKGGIREESG